ncbi:tetratricopeptide repeat protein [Nostoc sp. 2RC]|uniref:tetratricopeptide repeat protein n=1 Tax=Nostoc sp. 2RC TaxID=2485484 RepID=UPI00162A5592|nr:tetratricopeptide repeat protein [Nostoc sp. 2RC]MBC1241611.1 tetratricopeptide repeat protein [Nostoc sp. 2RC]
MLADILAQLQKQASAGESGVAAAFELNWQCLESETQKLACLLSLFALAPIPWSLVESAASHSDLEFDLKANRTILVERYLLQELADDSYQVHERIQELLRQKLEELTEADELKRGYCQAMVAVAKDIPQTPTLTEIAQATLAIPHLAEVATVYQAWLSDDDLISPFIGLGRFYQGQGAYTQALPWREQSLLAARKRFGDEHPAVATSLNNLAGLYRSQGRYSEAEALYIQALAMRKRLLEDEHPDVATSLNNLAGLYDSQGRYSNAEPLYIEALAMRKRLLGDEHPDVATSLNNLAGLYDSQGRYTEAEALYIQALAMKKRLVGDKHPSVATSLNNLAELYRSQGRYSDAEPLYIQALEIGKRLLGDKHPSVATSLNNLAFLYKSQGRYSDAEPLYIEALEIDKRLLGDEHPDVAIDLNNLAGLYESQGRYSDAKPLYIEALAMRKRLLGDEHPDVANSLNNLAFLYKSQGRYSDAEPLYIQALAMTKRLLGDEHPSVATSLNNLAALYRSQGRYSEAEALYIQPLEMRKRLLGKKIEPLVGEDLLKKLKELENLSKEEKAKHCGYYTVTKNGTERVNMMKFLNALIDAEGIQLDSTPSANAHDGRSASYRISVQSNGELIIGSAYAKQMNLKPGDEFVITLGKKHIRLRQVDPEDPEGVQEIEATAIRSQPP